MSETSVLDAAPANFRRGAEPTRHQVRRAAAVRALTVGLHGDALDYGCGWGDIAAMLAPQFDSIVGVDTDPARVAFAREEYAPLQFAECASSGTSFPDASFDVVLSVVVLHFVPSDHGYLQECHRLLRSGGTLVIMLQNPESFWMWCRRLAGREPSGKKSGGTTHRELEQFLTRHGFTIMRTEGFYDPAFDRVKTGGDVIISLLNGIGHLFRLPRFWSYVGYRCIRAA